MGRIFGHRSHQVALSHACSHQIHTRFTPDSHQIRTGSHEIRGGSHPIRTGSRRHSQDSHQIREIRIRFARFAPDSPDSRQIRARFAPWSHQIRTCSHEFAHGRNMFIPDSHRFAHVHTGSHVFADARTREGPLPTVLTTNKKIACQPAPRLSFPRPLLQLLEDMAWSFLARPAGGVRG